LREISVMYAGKTVLVVCHGGVMKSFLTHIGFFKSRPSENMIANTGYMKLRTDGVDFFLEDTNGIKSE
ncbi:MAG TPA: histidine phosphatase family protein, partial [Candidatus Saccharimonadales bacterium]|nr:histidine phosphatase family protein [Candidatus Saccharimonadales bacterium]